MYKIKLCDPASFCMTLFFNEDTPQEKLIAAGLAKIEAATGEPADPKWRDTIAAEYERARREQDPYA